MDDQISAALVEENNLVSGIVIPNVVLDLLAIPFQCAEFRIERNDRVGVEIIAFPIRADKILPRITCAVIDQVGLRIVASWKPSPAPAILPALAGPARRILFNGLEFPQFLPSLRFDAINLSCCREIAGGRSEGQSLASQYRRRGEVAAVAICRVSQLRLPELSSGLLVDRNAASVNRADKNLASPDRDAAAVGREQDLFRDRLELWLISPDFFAGRRVQRRDAVAGGDRVDYAVDNDWSFLDAVGNVAALVNPSHFELADICLVDLVERTVPPAVVGTVVLRPIVRTLGPRRGAIGGSSHSDCKQ